MEDSYKTRREWCPGVKEEEFLTLLTVAPKPNKMRTEEGPSYWAISKNEETKVSSFEKSDNDEKQRNGAITRKRLGQGRNLRMLV